MIVELDMETREDNRAKVQATFGRRLLAARDCRDTAKMNLLPPGLRLQVAESYGWAEQNRLLRPAFEANSFCVVVATPEFPDDRDSLIRELRHLAEMFLALEPRAKMHAASKLLMALFFRRRRPKTCDRP